MRLIKLVLFLCIPISMGIAMNDPYEDQILGSLAANKAKQEQAVKSFMKQLLSAEQEQDSIHAVLINKIKALFSDAAMKSDWHRVLDAIKNLVDGGVKKMALTEKEANTLWQLLALEKELLDASGENLSEDKLAALQMKIITLVAPLKMAAAQVGIPSQEDIALSFALVLLELLQQSLKNHAPVNPKKAQGASTLGEPIVPERMPVDLDIE